LFGACYPFHHPSPKDVGVASVDAECQSRYHLKAVQFHAATVLVTMEATHPTLVENPTFEDRDDVTYDLCNEATEQVGDAVFGYPNRAVGGGMDCYPPLIYCDV
jgi:hypothetical protein